MAVDRAEFTEKVDTGIKASKDFKRFYVSFRKNGKLKQKVLDYSTKNWDKKTRCKRRPTWTPRPVDMWTAA